MVICSQSNREAVIPYGLRAASIVILESVFTFIYYVHSYHANRGLMYLPYYKQLAASPLPCLRAIVPVRACRR